MCGIAGILNLDHGPVDVATLERMCDLMAHRGPDDWGMFLDGPVGLGHRRLSIIDLSDAGHQPMFNEDRTIALVFNGEIYNFKELRRELYCLGHQWSSQTDTEVVIHAYEEWGEKCVTRFNGMFAFGLWDSRKRQLFLARDRYGIKPLYYHEDAERFIFASEIKPILAAGVKKSACLGALDEYFTFQNIYTDRTLFEGVKTLPAGTWATVGIKSTEGSNTMSWFRTDRNGPKLDPKKVKLHYYKNSQLDPDIKARVVARISADEEDCDNCGKKIANAVEVAAFNFEPGVFGWQFCSGQCFVEWVEKVKDDFVVDKREKPTV